MPHKTPQNMTYIYQSSTGMSVYTSSLSILDEEVGPAKNLSKTSVNPAYVAPPLTISCHDPLSLFKYAPVMKLPQTEFQRSSTPPLTSQLNL
mmetsp:Transcript_15612/g.37513  ORF Transcript_15612/g.37513 Transcript_15612/m.37513 type:complete len:92 (+) Transcript_15612:290-565(+)